MLPTGASDGRPAARDVDRARARLWLDAAGQALACGVARLPDSLPLRSLLERFSQEVGRRG